MEQLYIFLNTQLFPAAFDSLKKLDLYLKEGELSVVTLGFLTIVDDSSLLNCHNLPNVSE